MSFSLHASIRTHITVFVICISTTDSVRLSIIANLYLIFDLHSYPDIFIGV